MRDGVYANFCFASTHVHQKCEVLLIRAAVEGFALVLVRFGLKIESGH
jgi:hypothetical protein